MVLLTEGVNENPEGLITDDDDDDDPVPPPNPLNDDVDAVVVVTLPNLPNTFEGTANPPLPLTTLLVAAADEVGTTDGANALLYDVGWNPPNVNWVDG